MLSKPSLLTRVLVGEVAGLVIGLIFFFAMLVFWPQIDPMLRWGVLFWYATLGAFVGLLGVYARHPVLRFPMPWWLRGPGLGAWMNLLLVFMAYGQMQSIMQAIFGADAAAWLISPFWAVFEGAVVGGIIAWLAQRLGGEGAATVEADIRNGVPMG